MNSTTSQPLEVEHLLTEDQRRLAIAINATRPPPMTIEDEAGDIRNQADIGTVRNRCIRKIIALIGAGGLQGFLRDRQPALGDRSGAELLQNHPQELLERLTALERSMP